MNNATVLPFPNRRADTSPQPDIASVGVKHTAAGCEPGVDFMREANIRFLGGAWLLAMLADDRVSARELWEAYANESASRSPDAVARMERARGLR